MNTTEYERGFVAGMQKQAQSSVDKTVNSAPTKLLGPNLVEILNSAGFYRKRPWVGLTDAEIKAIVGPWGSTEIKGYTRKLFDQIETKLKEKNT